MQPKQFRIIHRHRPSAMETAPPYLTIKFKEGNCTGGGRHVFTLGICLEAACVLTSAGVGNLRGCAALLKKVDDGEILVSPDGRINDETSMDCGAAILRFEMFSDMG